MLSQRSRFFALLAIVLLAASASSAHAFGLTGIGGRIGSSDPEGGDGTLAGGAHLEFEESGTQIHMQPNFIFWSNDGLSDWNPNFDAYYHFSRAGTVSPYLGGGVGLHFYDTDGSSDTDLGLNLLGGLLIPAGSTRFFVEGRYVATDRSQTSIYGGLTLPLGSHRSSNRGHDEYDE